jgi:hypothetical protein
MLADDPSDQNDSAESFHVLSIIVNGRLKRRLLTVVDATNLRAVNRVATVGWRTATGSRPSQSRSTCRRGCTRQERDAQLLPREAA